MIIEKEMDDVQMKWYNALCVAHMLLVVAIIQYSHTAKVEGFLLQLCTILLSFLGFFLVAN